jgi:hypothetical protein
VQATLALNDTFILRSIHTRMHLDEFAPSRSRSTGEALTLAGATRRDFGAAPEQRATSTLAGRLSRLRELGLTRDRNARHNPDGNRTRIAGRSS